MRAACLPLLLMSTLPLSAQLHLMPMPARVEVGQGRVPAGDVQIERKGPPDSRLDTAVARFRNRLGSGSGARTTLTIQTLAAGQKVQQLREDESYRLEIKPGGLVLTAHNALGAMHGLETLLQLHENASFPVLTINDKPRFPWRGLHMDVARHFMPVDVVKRNLDGMAAVKLNVLHWHLSDDQGFRVESKRFPKLQEKGSDGFFYTQDQIKDVVAYARDRGIRVVPEFDIPGHATSWLVGYPELSAGPGPFRITRTWGIFDPTLDPANPKVYEFLDGFIGEMSALFPDAYFHIGGDEVTGKQWKANTGDIASLMQEKGWKNMAPLHAYFNQRVQQSVAKYGKKMEGWDEILNDALPREIVIQSWRGQASLFEAVRQGFSGILSAGYYLDHMETAAKMYQVDPLDEKGRASGMLREPQQQKAAETRPLTLEQQSRVLGGEVCMWTEYVSPETMDSRIWPRTAAIAERFWSPASVNDIPDMYRRLDFISSYLDRVGLKHNANYTAMLQRLAGSQDPEPLRVLADAVEPGDLGLRHRLKRDYTQQTPLDRFVDAARPDSPAVRRFGDAVTRYAANSNDQAALGEIRRWLQLWVDNDPKIQSLIAKQPGLREVGPVSTALRTLAESALSGNAQSPEATRLAKTTAAEVRIAVAPFITQLNLHPR